MYMSYCRFEGTLAEVRNCLGEVENHLAQEECYKVSEREINCFEMMVNEFADFLYNSELLDEYGNIDPERLAEVCEEMRKSYGKEEW